MLDIFDVEEYPGVHRQEATGEEVRIMEGVPRISMMSFPMRRSADNPNLKQKLKMVRIEIGSLLTVEKAFWDWLIGNVFICSVYTRPL